MKKLAILFIFVLTLFLGIEGVSSKIKTMNYYNDDSVCIVCQYSFDYNN